MKPFIVLSDLHLGHGPQKEKREEEFIEFLKNVKNSDLILLGDIFDFWIEYKSVIYKRYLKVLCVFLEFMQKGNKIYFIPGNHDFYNTHYLSSLGFIVKRYGMELEWREKKVYMHHGDVFSFKGRITRFFYGNIITKMAFKFIHPDLGIRLANIVSKTPSKKETKAKGFMPEGTKKLFENYDIIITGHTHSPGIRKIEGGKYYINTGEWIFKRNYVKIDEDTIVLYDGERIIMGIS